MTIAVTEAKHKSNVGATDANGVQCKIDGVWVHRIDLYLAHEYPHITVDQYQTEYPGAKLFSPALEAKRAEMAEPVLEVAAMAAVLDFPASVTKTFAEVFEFGEAAAAKNKRGEPIKIDILGKNSEWAHFLPDIDKNYIFDIDLTKQVMMAVSLKMPMLMWGMHGTGKTTLILQFMARTNRPAIRIQHTVSTEEAHVLGQYVVRDGSTHFQPGPLAIAMKYGLVYIADEYDFALPSVTSVYQPVLEGHALVIKDAPPEWQLIRPHPNFRFFATGNTNGGGDETGLYQGTQMQNAANYSRFGITVEVGYMDAKKEAAAVASQSGIHTEDAAKLVSFAKHVREAYARGDIGTTVSPRELINAATLGRSMGGEWKQGLSMAYMNRLNKVDKEAVQQMAQRIFSS